MIIISYHSQFMAWSQQIDISIGACKDSIVLCICYGGVRNNHIIMYKIIHPEFMKSGYFKTNVKHNFWHFSCLNLLKFIVQKSLMHVAF